MNLLQRVSILSGGLLMILIPWYFLLYGPQTDTNAQIEIQVDELKNKTIGFQMRYDRVLTLVKSNDTGKLVARYQKLQEKMKRLNQQIDQFHHRYISDTSLAKLLNAILGKVDNVKIQNFSTIIKTAQPDATPTTGKKVETPDKSAVSKEAPQPSNFALGMSYYVLTLKGDFFSIVNFLKNIEQLEWQIFWTKLDYEVQQYPDALATVEFYTLRPALTLITPHPEGTAP